MLCKLTLEIGCVLSIFGFLFMLLVPRARVPAHHRELSSSSTARCSQLEMYPYARHSNIDSIHLWPAVNYRHQEDVPVLCAETENPGNDLFFRRRNIDICETTVNRDLD
jgi:hypothetical protein